MKVLPMTISHHNRRIYGNLFLPDKDGVFSLVIFSHGYNGIGENFKENAEYLVKNGIAAFCYDFCGGSVNSKSSMATTDMTVFTEKEDLKAVISTLKEHKNIDSDNVFLFGESQGGLVTTLAIEEAESDIRGVVLLFPAMCIEDNWVNMFKSIDNIPDTVDFWGMTLGKNFYLTLYNYNTFAHIGSYSKNILVFHGDCDDIVPLEYSNRLCETYQNIELKVFKGEGHGFSAEGNKKVYEMTLDFVLKNRKVR